MHTEIGLPRLLVHTLLAIVAGVLSIALAAGIILTTAAMIFSAFSASPAVVNKSPLFPVMLAFFIGGIAACGIWGFRTALRKLNRRQVARAGY